MNKEGQNRRSAGSAISQKPERTCLKKKLAAGLYIPKAIRKLLGFHWIGYVVVMARAVLMM